ncbi:MAG: efflux RND transporter periplasmic adaptor subunit [Muribaculaceae bacterium]|nr:efflux RND transporter periplasmic adaptor subunit [Muribaculaceae bacterium]
MKKFFKVLMWVIIALIFIGTFVYLFINSSEKDTVYELVSPTNGSIERTTVLTGKIEPRDKIEIKPQVSGIISEINVEAGDQVKEGDIIAKIKVVPDEGQLASAESRVKLAELSLANQKATFSRTKELYEKKFESRENFEKDQLALDQAREELDAARENLSIVRDGISTSNAKSSNTLVRATISGLVLEVPVKVGSSVIQANTMNDGTTIASVADMSDIIFNGKIDETEVAMLSEGMDVEITIGAISNGNMKAVIEKIAPMATEDNGTNTFEIKAAINVDQEIELRAGYSANATVILEREENALTIPERVIDFEGDSTFVYVLDKAASEDKQVFKRTPITTGISDGVNIAVKGGDITTENSLRGSKNN